MKKSLMCRIFGCRWTERIVTHVKQEYKEVGCDGMGFPIRDWVPVEYGYTNQLSHCSKCGTENPNFSG